MEKGITRITFTFEDGKTRTLKGEELNTYKAWSVLLSDYMLPGDEYMVLASWYGGLCRGFASAEALEKLQDEGSRVVPAIRKAKKGRRSNG